MKRLSSIIIYTILVLLALSMLVPFLWMLSTSLMGELEVYQFPPRFFPSVAHWSNFMEAMTLQPFGRFFLNTLIIASVSVVGQLLFCSMAAYAFARLRFPWRNKMFSLYLGTMMIPAIV